MKIERVTEKDTAELLSIYSHYVEKTAVSFEWTTPTLAEFSDRIKKISSRFPYLKAVEEKEILGYCYASTFKPRMSYDRSVETTVYVRQDVRKKGVGTALYAALERSLQDMGILNMNACITAPRDTPDPFLTDASPRFHEKMGFRQVGRFSACGFKFDRWYDMIWMEKHIGEHGENPKPVRFGEWSVI